jgi:hypothetical protein
VNNHIPNDGYGSAVPTTPPRHDDYAEVDMKPERIRWKRSKGRQQLLLDKIYDAVTEEFTRDAMASLASVLAHLCVVADVAKPKALESFGNAYDT